MEQCGYIGALDGGGSSSITVPLPEMLVPISIRKDLYGVMVATPNRSKSRKYNIGKAFPTFN